MCYCIVFLSCVTTLGYWVVLLCCVTVLAGYCTLLLCCVTVITSPINKMSPPYFASMKCNRAIKGTHICKYKSTPIHVSLGAPRWPSGMRRLLSDRWITNSNPVGHLSPLFPRVWPSLASHHSAVQKMDLQLHISFHTQISLFNITGSGQLHVQGDFIASKQQRPSLAQIR